MAKKRAAPNSDRRSNRVEHSTRGHHSTDSANSRDNPSHKLITISCLFFFIVSSAISLFVCRKLYAPPHTVPPLPYIYQRDLVKTDVNYQEILTENAKELVNGTGRQFSNPVLAYITPWNSRGYDLAKKFNSKLTHISPVWYDLKSQGTKLVLEGRHNVDTGWISDLRMAGHAQVLPRIVLEANPVDLLTKKKQRDRSINLILKECKEMNYDGIVLESWSRWAGYGILHDPDMRNMALQFIKQLGQAMHSVVLERNKQSLQLIYVIGPPRTEKLHEHDFGPEDLRSLSDAVDGYSLMTYDFSSPHSPGPNAPLKWVRSTVHMLLGFSNAGAQDLAQKIFVGINFYGNDFVLSGGLGGGPIIGREYLSLLEQYKPQLQWEKNSDEHFFLYTDSQHVKHVVFYPSLMSIAKRLEEARSWGAGISIWEIGQGLDYFFDIL